ncbi:MAG: anti-sigma factor [Candidatus Omnitrophota bacterium]
MKCRACREEMLTGYLDGEMDRRKRNCLEEHLARCAECRKFLEEAKKTGPELFRNTVRSDPPEYLWRRIRETILTEREESKSSAAGIFERIRIFSYIPKPALALAVVITLILIVGTTARIGVKSQSGLDPAIQEQMGYFYYLSDSSGDVSSNGSLGFGTQVEKYFM